MALVEFGELGEDQRKEERRKKNTQINTQRCAGGEGRKEERKEGKWAGSGHVLFFPNFFDRFFFYFFPLVGGSSSALVSCK